MTVTAKAIGWLATHDDPLTYGGHLVMREIGQKPSTFAPPRDGGSEALSPVAKHVSETPVSETPADSRSAPEALPLLVVKRPEDATPQPNCA